MSTVTEMPARWVDEHKDKCGGVSCRTRVSSISPLASVDRDPGFLRSRSGDVGHSRDEQPDGAKSSEASVPLCGNDAEARADKPVGYYLWPARTVAEVDDGYILSVDRFGDPRKNVRLRLQACRHLRENPPDAPPMMLVGEQSRYVDWKEAGSWGIAEHMDVRVNVAPGLLPSLYRQASLFVLPSNEDGVGIEMLEAMASGLPVVSTRCGVPATCVAEGVTGYATPIGDAEASAHRMPA